MSTQLLAVRHKRRSAGESRSNMPIARTMSSRTGAATENIVVEMIRQHHIHLLFVEIKERGAQPQLSGVLPCVDGFPERLARFERD
jgi:hypothetical protein